MKKVLITGGAGFIGSELVRQFIRETDYAIINADKLTYAGNLESLAEVALSPRYYFEHVDICDAPSIRSILSKYRPCAIVHLAAESHVDRSIDSPLGFLRTNILGTSILLEAAREHFKTISAHERKSFRFHHVSTDEVYGTLGNQGVFEENTPYNPSSPYSASKAASDHLVRAWSRTYGLPTIITNCSNNYGPYQFPEKLIPLMIIRALRKQTLPIYGNGDNVRDWLFVEDHCRALRLVLEEAPHGETFNIGGNCEKTNFEVVSEICSILDEIRPRADAQPYEEQIKFVADRPGHDFRYAVGTSKVESALGWKPRESFSSGLRKTIEWYLSNEEWYTRVQDGSYQGQRLGVLL